MKLRNPLLVLLFCVCLAAAAAPAHAGEQIAVPISSAICGSAGQDEPAAEQDGQSLLEEILRNRPEDPVYKAIDSGECCTSSSQCPSVSGYSKRCSSGSCPSAYTCLYTRL